MTQQQFLDVVIEDSHYLCLIGGTYVSVYITAECLQLVLARIQYHQLS